MSEPVIDQRLPENPNTNRLWMARATNWITQRLPYALLLVGIIITLKGLVPTINLFMAKPRYTFSQTVEYVYTSNGESISLSSYSNTYKSPERLSIYLTAGAAFSFLGILWAARRFSLRWLMIAVILTGALGVIPFQATARPAGTASFKVLFPKALSEEQIQQLRHDLDPEFLLPTLPDDYRALLSSRPHCGILDISVEAAENRKKSDQTNLQGGVKCILILRPELTQSENLCLIQAYDYCVRYLALTAAETQGITVNQKSGTLKAGAPFNTFQNEWLKRFRAKSPL